MSDTKLSFGQAIDQLVVVLKGLSKEDQITSILAVCKHLDIQISPNTQNQESKTPVLHKAGSVNSQEQISRTKQLDIRALKEDKKPDSARQMACIVAYYLQECAPEGERKDAISTPDLEKYFKQANFKLPKKIDQVLKDAKNSGYFESPARGEYKLNAVGYNLVVHGLPVSKGA